MSLSDTLWTRGVTLCDNEPAGGEDVYEALTQ